MKRAPPPRKNGAPSSGREYPRYSATLVLTVVSPSSHRLRLGCGMRRPACGDRHAATGMQMLQRSNSGAYRLTTAHLVQCVDHPFDRDVALALDDRHGERMHLPGVAHGPEFG
jgi:hypothetical protein